MWQQKLNATNVSTDKKTRQQDIYLILHELLYLIHISSSVFVRLVLTLFSMGWKAELLSLLLSIFMASLIHRHPSARCLHLAKSAMLGRPVRVCGCVLSFSHSMEGDL